MLVETIAFIDKGVKNPLRMVNKSSFLNEVQELFEADAKVWVRVETFRDTRTLPQNARMHAYFDKIGKHTGQDKHQVKSALKMKFLMRGLKDKDGNDVV